MLVVFGAERIKIVPEIRMAGRFFERSVKATIHPLPRSDFYSDLRLFTGFANAAFID